MVGEPIGIRVDRWYRLQVVVEICPVDAREDITAVTVYFKQGEYENNVAAEYQQDVGDWAQYCAYIDITKRHTYTGEDGRYTLRATCIYLGDTYETEEEANPSICIRKGDQIWYTVTSVAEGYYNSALDCWLHYPYHWGGKGPNRCSFVVDHSEPADGFYDHEPYSNFHPSGNHGVHHYCCFDCSGFVYYIYKLHGIDIPDGTADDQWSTLTSWGWGISPASAAKPGDLIFWPGHVAVAGYARAHAPGTGAWTRGEPGRGAPSRAAGPSGAGWCMTDDCSH